MERKEITKIINACYSELKDFQLATVENIYHKLYIENKNRHLVADEVGLGKTIVAKGLIAKAMEHHMNSPKKNKPFKVVYICSSQALTGQNLRKLNIFKKKEFIEKDKGRLIFQAFKSSNDEIFQVSSLTPSTSFRLVSGTGRADERKLIWMILSDYEIFKRGKRKNGLKLTLLGNKASERYFKNKNKEKEKRKKDIQDWKDELDNYKDEKIKTLRPQVKPKFKEAVSKEKIDLEISYFKEIRNELGLKGKVNLQEIIIKYSELLRVDNVKNYKGPIRILGKLRKLLTEVCLDFMEADLYILDEFQRFKDLITSDEERITEATVIAQKVFNTSHVKILLLSATPFKPFTTRIDADFEEDHHKEFTDVLTFLFNSQKEKLIDYEINRKAFFDYLRRPEEINEVNTNEKTILEQLYREVISRTERLLVSDDKNTLLKNTASFVELKKEDILNFIETDKIIQKLIEISQKSNQTLVDFSKSAPFPLSFMEKYKVKEDLATYSKNSKELKQTIKKYNYAWVDTKRIHEYKPLGEIPNGNMRELFKHSLTKGMWKQIWLAPCLPYYELEGSFKEAKNNSKVLIFSKWRMVPRTIASMISYEAERLTIGNSKLHVEGGVQYTPDYYPNERKKRQPRKPGKILALKVKNGKSQTMNVFSMVYPSITLSKLYSLQDNVRKENRLSLAQVTQEIKTLLKRKLEEAKLTQYKSVAKKTKNWYWAAPLMLDKYFHRDTFDNWFQTEKYKQSVFLSNRRYKQNEDDIEEGDNDNISAIKHLDELKNGYFEPRKLQLGEFPDDLLDVLALQVIASPAIAALRMLIETFPKIDEIELLNNALDIGAEFHSLFDKPESIAIIKLAAIEKKGKAIDTRYWREILDYCVIGNLQAVIDEFAALLAADYDNVKDLTKRMCSAINIRTSKLNIDDIETLGTKKERVVMRCHYAVDFGNQNMDKEEGLNRVVSILENFNSPFRPFVLASTTIGQEGLDFHYYCRKVMHWNLPTNPIDIEQREGRVNRYKGLVIRQNLIEKYSKYLVNCKTHLWDYLYDLAETEEGKKMNKCQLVPFWHIEGAGINIERIIPLIPFSREVSRLEKLLATLTLYRLTFGQPRQEELVEALYKENKQEIINAVREKLMINLSPITY